MTSSKSVDTIRFDAMHTAYGLITSSLAFLNIKTAELDNAKIAMSKATSLFEVATTNHNKAFDDWKNAKSAYKKYKKLVRNHEDILIAPAVVFGDYIGTHKPSPDGWYRLDTSRKPVDMSMKDYLKEYRLLEHYDTLMDLQVIGCNNTEQHLSGEIIDKIIDICDDDDDDLNLYNRCYFRIYSLTLRHNHMV